ncbi:uncharacterized protein LOC134206531 [Armigeres subalbatus]|uniref:uncharacterized protein LOC134206531 n=1 Tax=Armigeres subalbatus TaxID=124917 RepID=UPI002ED03369
MDGLSLVDLKHKVLSITKKTDEAYKCTAALNCKYSQPLNKFMLKKFARHIKTFHLNVYNALLGEKLLENRKGNWREVYQPKTTIKARVLSFVKQTPQGYVCGLGDNCTYTHPLHKLVANNFVRHVLTNHVQDYERLDLGRMDQGNSRPTLKRNDPSLVQVPAKVSRFRFMCGLIRLVTTHGLPFECVSWEGMQDIISPHLEALKITMDELKIRSVVYKLAERMQDLVREDLRGRMVALQLHGVMGKSGQYMVQVSCTYMKNGHISKQALGAIVLDETNTCIDFEDKVNKIKERWGLEQWQIYTMSIDHGRIYLPQRPTDGEPEHLQQNADVDDSKFVEVLGQYNATLNEVNVLQCGLHLLSMVATEVTQEYAETIDVLIETMKKFRYDVYKPFFQAKMIRYPPIPDRNFYGFGTYLMMKALRDDRPFYEYFCTKHPGYTLNLQWDFIEEFVLAFEPLYECASWIGNCGLSDFHLQCLLAYGRIRCLDINRFKDSLLSHLETRQKMLLDLAPYRAALFMDPRLNFRGSKLFDHNMKEKIVTFLLSIYTMTGDEEPKHDNRAPSCTSTQSSGDFSMNAYLTEMLGEGSSELSMEDLIREIQHQERCDADDRRFDIIKYWAQKKMHDPRLWTLAMTVFSPLITHCETEEDLTQVMLRPDRRAEGFPNWDNTQSMDTTEEDDMWNVLLVRQNPSLLEKAVREVCFKGQLSDLDSNV